MKKSIVVIETILLAVIIVLCLVSGVQEKLEEKKIIAEFHAFEQNEVLSDDTPTAAVYIICDVESITDGKVNVILPIGTVYPMDMPVDAPDFFSEVVVVTENQDDYSTYKIIGLR